MVVTREENKRSSSPLEENHYSKLHNGTVKSQFMEDLQKKKK
jgi:hypothetical protein